MGAFKAYDVRGIYPTEINEDLAYNIGRAFVIFTKAKKVLLGQDARLSSPALNAAVIKGATDQGANVVDIGLVTTPMIKFLQQHLNYESAIQITASHNPKEYGGMKVYGENANQITDMHGLKEIEALARKGVFPEAEKGTITKENHLKEYAQLVAEFVDTDITHLHVVVDASNGPGGMVCEALFPLINIQYSALNFEPDGNFPGHDPNPLKGDAQKQAINTVAEMGADFGCIFDADGDRAIFIDEEGQAVPRGNIAAAIADDYLEQTPGSTIICDAISSHIFKDAVTKAGGKPLINRTGAAFMMHRMRDEDAIFGGEDSGHYFYKDMKCSDHAVYTLLRIMRIVAKENKPLSKIVKKYSTYTDTDQINVPVGEDAKTAVEKVAGAFKDYEQEEISGGYSIEFNDGQGTWLRVQPSNTEPVIRMRIESKDAKKVDELKEKVMKLVA